MTGLFVNGSTLKAVCKIPMFLIFMSSLHSQANTVYKSIGQLGETRYSQLRPATGSAQALTVYRPASARLTPVCQQLHNNLKTLTGGGAIHEIDSQGNQQLLTTSEIARHIRETQAAMREQCP